MTNPFATADTWDVSTGEYLGVGNHVVKITNVEDDTAAVSGKPKLKIGMENAEGSTVDFVPYSETFLQKVVSVFDAAYGDKDHRPGEGEFDPQDHCRLTAACRKRLLGKTVGIVMREDKDSPKLDKETGLPRLDGFGNPTYWVRVQGYVHPSAIKASGASPASTSTQTQAPVTFSSSVVEDDDIPF